MKPAQYAAALETVISPVPNKMEALKDSRRMWPIGTIYETDWTKGKSIT